MVEAYPILKILRLKTHLETLPPDGNAVLSAFRFPHLTTLTLFNLQLLDGSALIPVKSKISSIYNASSLNLVVLDHQRMPEARNGSP